MLAAYILLALSIIAEVIAASFVTATHGFTNPKPTPTYLQHTGYTVSYTLFGFALTDIDLGIAYATWGAVGIVT